MRFLEEERGNIALWIIYVGCCLLVVVLWIILFEIIQTHLFPIAIDSGADQTRPYGYMVGFLRWFPAIALFGYALYAIKNSQKPEPYRGPYT